MLYKTTVGPNWAIWQNFMALLISQNYRAQGMRKVLSGEQGNEIGSRHEIGPVVSSKVEVSVVVFVHILVDLK